MTLILDPYGKRVFTNDNALDATDVIHFTSSDVGVLRLQDTVDRTAKNILTVSEGTATITLEVFDAVNQPLKDPDGTPHKVESLHVAVGPGAPGEAVITQAVEPAPPSGEPLSPIAPSAPGAATAPPPGPPTGVPTGAPPPEGEVQQTAPAIPPELSAPSPEPPSAAEGQPVEPAGQTIVQPPAPVENTAPS